MTHPIIVIGKTGQVARAIINQLDCSNRPYLALGRSECDLSASRGKIREALERLPQASGVILAAAYTDVDGSESDEELAFAVNRDGPQIVGEFCASRNLPLVHFSTDYVFNGQKTQPYRVDDDVDPLNVYGRSKRGGEVALMAVKNLNVAILRTSWVYDGEAKNFVTTMLKLAQRQTSISVVDDQFGRPTFARDLAKAALNVMDVLNNEKTGKRIIHVTGTGPRCSWAEFAREIFENSKDEKHRDVKTVSVSSDQFPRPAKRPKFSVLDNQSYEDLVADKMPDWRSSLIEALEGLNR